MFRALVLLFAILAPLRLEAIEGTITISEVTHHPNALSVRFTGLLEGFQQVYIFELLRPTTFSATEWANLHEELNAKRGKPVEIAIQSKRHASRGPLLTIFDFEKIEMVDVK